MSGQTMDCPANMADQLMDPTLQIYTQGPQSNISQGYEDFQTALENYQLQPQDFPHQLYTDEHSRQETAGLTGDQNGQFNVADILEDTLEDTASLEAFLNTVEDQSTPLDIDNINPSIAQLMIRQPAAQLPGLDIAGQHPRGPIRLPDSLTVATAMTSYNPLAIQQGTLESPTPTPIAIIIPLASEMASSAAPTMPMTNQNPHRIKNHASTVPAQLIQPGNGHAQAAVPTADQNSPTPVTSIPSSDQPAIQSESKKKSKSRKKRSRAERKTPTSSPSSSLVLEKKKLKTTDNSQYSLPADNELLIQLYYQKHNLGERKINSQDGFLVYHKKAWRFSDTGTDLDLINMEFPQLEEIPTKFKMTPSQKKSTEKLLDAMTKGVHVYHDESHNIYVERFCKSHVMCYTTDLGKDDSTDNVLQRRDLVYQIKLEQGKRIKVFDNKNFREKLVHRFLTDIPIKSPPLKSPPPFVILSFGQTWQEGFPLNNNLVYMKITPLLPREQYSLDSTPSFDCDRTTLLTSFSSLSLNSH